MDDKAGFDALLGTTRNHVKCLRISLWLASQKGEDCGLLMVGLYSPFSKSG